MDLRLSWGNRHYPPNLPQRDRKLAGGRAGSGCESDREQLPDRAGQRESGVKVKCVAGEGIHTERRKRQSKGGEGGSQRRGGRCRGGEGWRDEAGPTSTVLTLKDFI